MERLTRSIPSMSPVSLFEKIVAYVAGAMVVVMVTMLIVTAIVHNVEIPAKAISSTEIEAWKTLTTIRMPPTPPRAYAYQYDLDLDTGGPWFSASSSVGLEAHLGDGSWVGSFNPCAAGSANRFVAVVHDHQSHRTVFVPCEGMVYVVPDEDRPAYIEH